MAEHLNSITLDPVKAAVLRFEKSKLGQQVFRFVRLVGVGVASWYATHSSLDSAAVVAIVEVAFRAVFNAPDVTPK